ncbi:MAG: ABC transporter permease [Cyclobacteriaceae bacterium]|nr:ABC transporter permease [Cyclobacteriaceae bacterium]MCB0498440.1 ABC transporter permease [Cyclobacteriaceae bacterium]MCB9236990.1 ABC transporter permease [Flammeovirgaceae bacterium]MCO5271636.1 ABC transporter permease [Cyclobacteriaceae bacterium]MCW5901300.1 ABC transporter permease [Cyclobacteriaceae bacterium]
MVRNYLLTTLRNIRKHFSYSLINIFGLGLGISISLLLALWVRHEVSYDRFHANADNIYRVSMEMSFGGQSAKHSISPTALLPALEKNFPEVITGTRVYNPASYNPFIVKRNDNFFQEGQFYFADSTFFDVLTYPLIKGNPKTALVKPNSVVLTEGMAKKYFGQEDPLGQTLLINGNKDYTVTGVTKDAPGNSYLNFDFIGSFSSLWQSREEQWWSANYQTFVLVDKNTDLAALRQKTNDLVKKALADELSNPGDYVRYNWTNIQDIHLRSDAATEMEPVGSIQYVYLFAAIAFLILLIACINYINLATARAAFRAKEVGVRKVVGASKGQLISQFIGESVVTTLCALVLAFLAAQLLLPLFNTLTGKNFGYSTLMEPAFLAYVIATAMAVALFSGAYPAFAITAFKPVNILKNNFRSSSSGIWLRKGLVVFQFCITLILTLGTLAITKQIFFIQNKNLGFDRENTIILPLDRETEKVYTTLRSEFLRSGRVAEMGRATESPVEINGGYSLGVLGSQDPPISITATSADEGFVPSLGMEVVSGRNFNENDIKNFYKDTTYAFMVNESALARLFLDKEEAIGKKVSLNGRNGEIVGVVRDFHFASLHMPIGPLAIFSGPNEYNFAFVKLNPGPLSQTLEELKSISNTVAPHRPFSYEFMDQQFEALYSAEHRMARLFAIFSTLAIVIACLGLLGLVSFSATQKTKEIGIRKVLGATAGNIVLLITNEYTKLIGMAILIAVPVSLYAINQMLGNFAYKTTIGPLSIALSVLACVCIAFCTASYQALKAAIINPTETLRNE